ncbi:MAG: response regulator [Terriglobales bacterium]
MKTLIVEDDFTSRLLLQTLLSPYGECHIAVNGREAVDAFRVAHDSGRSYDLICMDIMMPEMDGQAALKQIRALEEAAGVLPHAGVKIIMTTAVSDTKTVFASYEGLCDGYLFKPLDTGKLAQYLQSFGLLSPAGKGQASPSR